MGPDLFSAAVKGIRDGLIIAACIAYMFIK